MRATFVEVGSHARRDEPRAADKSILLFIHRLFYFQLA